MALKDRVRVNLVESPDLGAQVLQPQPPKIGVVTKFTDGDPDLSDVLFENGRVLKDVPETGLEIITNASQSNLDAALFAVVRPPGGSPEYTGQIVDVYVVRQTTLALVRTRNGMFYEIRLNLLTRVDLEGLPQ